MLERETPDDAIKIPLGTHSDGPLPIGSGPLPNPSFAADVGLRESFAAVLALARAAARHMLWGQRRVASEIEGWHSLARRIPDVCLRRHALDSLRDKRDQAIGASLFSTLPDKRHTGLLRLLVAYQILWDFLDTASEDSDAVGRETSAHMHRALVDALTPGRTVPDYFALLTETDDGGYLRALVETCQLECARLPAYPRAQPLVLAGVERCSVQALNHDRDPRRRELSLRKWARKEFPCERATPWFELTAAASAFLPHPLLALASESACADQDVARAYASYFPDVSLAVVMLDSYVDRPRDSACGAHSYLAYYRDEREALSRLVEVTNRMSRHLYALRRGPRHAVLGSCMIAMYLSDTAARAPESYSATRRLIRHSDALTRLSLPMLRMWRIYRLTSRAPSLRRCHPPFVTASAAEVGQC